MGTSRARVPESNVIAGNRRLSRLQAGTLAMGRSGSKAAFRPKHAGKPPPLTRESSLVRPQPRSKRPAAQQRPRPPGAETKAPVRLSRALGWSCGNFLARGPVVRDTSPYLRGGGVDLTRPEREVPMPYFRCPVCGLLAHVTTNDSTPIPCSRCRAPKRAAQLIPLDESLRRVGGATEGNPGARGQPRQQGR
jgi:hypothetical protein